VKTLVEVCCCGVEAVVSSGKLGNLDMQVAPLIGRIVVVVAPSGTFIRFF
jgi:hypothetical protein